MSWVLFLFISIIPFFSFAQVTQKFGEANDNASLVIDRNHAPPIVGSEWTDDFKKKFYRDPVGGAANRTSGVIMFETPLSALMIGVNKLTSDFSKKAPMIAQQCKLLNPDRPWEQISCAMKSVNTTFKRFKWPNSTSSCRAHAEAFREVFQALDIPRSNVGYFEGSTTTGDTHVVNRITLTDKNGRPFSYVVDVGWDPDQIFPLGEVTKEFHQNNKTLPEIKNENPKYTFQESRPIEKSCSPKKTFKETIQELRNTFKFKPADQ